VTANPVKKKPTIEELAYSGCILVLNSLKDGRKYVHQMSYDTRQNDQKVAACLEKCLMYGLVKKRVGTDSRNHKVNYYELTDRARGLIKIVDKSREQFQEYVDRLFNDHE
jgi:DNA-binding HxlR family transcriptional regulator